VSPQNTQNDAEHECLLGKDGGCVRELREFSQIHFLKRNGGNFTADLPRRARARRMDSDGRR
jgi:hypothetical protein